MTGVVWTPEKAAMRLTHIANAYSTHHKLPRFPVDVRELALHAAETFQWKDPITEIQAANIRSFEGALQANESRTKWMLLYNEKITSKGRIRFTQAHELGHYILHRLRKDGFECSPKHMLGSDPDEKDLEAQANVFASFLLMPLDDFRAEMGDTVDLDLLGRCADHYGVSFTAAALKWLSYTDRAAVLLMAKDGFIDWASSSAPARAAGAFFKTRTQTIEIPPGTMAADETVRHERTGVEIPASRWFRHAEPLMTIKEFKISADQYENTLTLLVLPRGAKVWEPWNQRR